MKKIYDTLIQQWLDVKNWFPRNARSDVNIETILTARKPEKSCNRDRNQNFRLDLQDSLHLIPQSPLAKLGSTT